MSVHPIEEAKQFFYFLKLLSGLPKTGVGFLKMLCALFWGSVKNVWEILNV